MTAEPDGDLDAIQAQIDAAQSHYEDELYERMAAAEAESGAEIEPPEVHTATEHVLNALDGIVLYLRRHGDG